MTTAAAQRREHPWCGPETALLGQPTAAAGSVTCMVLGLIAPSTLSAGIRPATVLLGAFDYVTVSTETGSKCPPLSMSSGETSVPPYMSVAGSIPAYPDCRHV